MTTIVDIRPMLEARRSGVAHYTAELLKRLVGLPRTDGGRFKLFCNSWGRKIPTDTPPESPVFERKFSRYPNRLLNASFAWIGRPLIEDLTGGGDQVYLPNLNFIATKKPLTVTVHDLSFVRFPGFFSPKQRLWHRAIDPRRLLRSSRTVVAVSEHTKTDVVESFGIAADRVQVVTPAAGPEYRPRDAREREEARRKYGLPENFFLFLGTVEPRKNVAGLITAFEKMTGPTALVIAGGMGWRSGEALRKAKSSPAGDRIKFIDYVDDADRPALYSAARVFVYPSFYEGFGMPPVEAMACGTPVVTSRTSSLPEVVGVAGLLIDPHDPSELAEAMSAAWGDEPLRRRLTEYGIEQSKKFSWERSAGRLDEILRGKG
jgi:glycosyltransferase involved in cell wall biosynthesis